MIIRPILIALLSFIVVSTFSQEIEWQKSLGGLGADEAHSVHQTFDGGYIVTGYTESNDGDVTNNHGEGDYWIVKLEPNGNMDWQKCFGGIVWEDGWSIQQTTDSGYIVAGYTESNAGTEFGCHTFGFDYWILKLDSIGNVDWQKCLGGTKWDFARSIQQTNDGGYIVAGSSKSDDGDVSEHHGSTIWLDYWIVKLSSDGAIIWEKSFGGSDNDEASSIDQTSDGGYIVAGISRSNDGDVSTNYGFDDYWIVKIDSIGNLIWEKTLGGSSWDKAYSVQQTSDGGYIIAGTTRSDDGDVTENKGADDFWIVKLDTLGNLTWQKSLGGSKYEEAYSIKQTNDGGYIVAGYTNSDDIDVSGHHGDYPYTDYWIVKLDPDGNLLWQKCFGGASYDQPYSIEQTSDGGYIVAGHSSSYDGDVTGNHWSKDFWILKIAPITTAIDQPEIKLNILLYPNPTSDIIFLESEKVLINPIISISTSDGKLLYQHRYPSKNQYSLDASFLPTGIYLLDIQSELNGQTGQITKKLFIE